MDFKKVKKGTLQLCKAVESLEITSSEKYEEGAIMRGVIKERLRKIDEARKLMVAPHLKKQREINNLFKEQIEPIDTLLSQLDSAMLAYKKNESDEALRRAKEQEGKVKPLEVVEAVEMTIKTEKSSTTVKKIWKAKILNKEIVFRKYPDFFIVNQSKLDEVARVVQAEKEFDGMLIYSENSLTTRLNSVL